MGREAPPRLREVPPGDGPARAVPGVATRACRGRRRVEAPREAAGNYGPWRPISTDRAVAAAAATRHRRDLAPRDAGRRASLAVCFAASVATSAARRAAS